VKVTDFDVHVVMFVDDKVTVPVPDVPSDQTRIVSLPVTVVNARTNAELSVKEMYPGPVRIAVIDSLIVTPVDATLVSSEFRRRGVIFATTTGVDADPLATITEESAVKLGPYPTIVAESAEPPTIEAFEYVAEAVVLAAATVTVKDTGAG